MSAAAAPSIAIEPALDSAKRRQILDGARKVFLAQGFEGASMNDITRAAGVSKGTLYVYFENKERLFAAIVAEERYAHVAEVFAIDDTDPDIESVLTRVGTNLIGFLINPRILSAMRVVMGISERMPDLGKEFYENGPCVGRRRLATYLEGRVAAGQLEIPDLMLAAAQFLELAQAPVVKPMFFGSTELPTPERIRTVVDSAVHMFMSAYGRKA